MFSGSQDNFGPARRPTSRALTRQSHGFHFQNETVFRGSRVEPNVRARSPQSAPQRLFASGRWSQTASPVGRTIVSDGPQSTIEERSRQAGAEYEMTKMNDDNCPYERAAFAPVLSILRRGYGRGSPKCHPGVRRDDLLCGPRSDRPLELSKSGARTDGGLVLPGPRPPVPKRKGTLKPLVGSLSGRAGNDACQ